jgi:hypothetical protein
MPTKDNFKFIKSFPSTIVRLNSDYKLNLYSKKGINNTFQLKKKDSESIITSKCITKFIN